MNERRRTGIEQLRKAVSLLNNTNESFNDRFSAHELISIAQAYTRSEYDITPDQWTTQEVEDAIDGKGTGATGDCLCRDCRDARPVQWRDRCEACLASAAQAEDEVNASDALDAEDAPINAHCPDADV